MRYRIEIFRKDRDNEKGYCQSFWYETESEAETVASALTALNEQSALSDTDGNTARKIEWDCSCLQKKCGACAMVINGVPRLACQAKLSEFPKGLIKLAPLSKFPVVCDLVVDRSIMFENLKTMKLWLTEDAVQTDKSQQLSFESSECIQCGCCLEICPNFYSGGKFYGMSAVPVTMRLLSESDKKASKEIIKQYAKHTFAGCGKSLACRNVCPKKIDTENLLVNANAIAIWKRF